MNHNDILSALDKQFSTNVSPVFINSLKKECSFREVTVKEQKTMTKIIIDNEGKEDVVYDATLAMIQSLCLDKDFEAINLTEFDRIKLLLSLYRQNFFNNEMSYTCKNCNHEGSYEIDFDKIIEQLDTVDLSDRIFEISNDTHIFKFTVNFPGVRRVRSYLKQLYKEKNDKNVKNKLSAIDYIDLFIKNIIIIVKENDLQILDCNFEDMSINDVEEIISKFPQGIIISRAGNSLTDKITKDFLSVIDATFNKNICGECGKEITLEVGLSDFFTF